MKRFIWVVAGLASIAQAHESTEHEPISPLVFAAIERNKVVIREEGAYRIIESNGIPNHKTGQFPNSENPNAIRSQQHQYKVALTPKLSGKITEMQRQPFGVALNGIPFDPGTAECYGQPRGGRPGSSCSWRQEAIVGGRGTLGLDSSNAHVQPTGAYHYHGIPNGLVSYLGGGDLVHVGYAADGFGMYVSQSGAYKPSYKLRSGTRPDGPGGAYDGTYTQDYQFVDGLGSLDQCNGTLIDGNYAYILTTSFPNIPRCWRGTPDSSFARQGQGSGMRGSRPEGGPSERRGPPPPRGHRPPPRI